MSANGIVWLHGAGLSSTDPALQANPQTPAIFVFDRPFLEANQIAFARLQFIFEAVLEAVEGRPHRVCVGVQADEIMAFARQQQTQRIHVTEVPSPEMTRTLDALKAAGFELILYAPERLTDFPGRVKRFSAFWKQVERQVLWAK